MPHAGTLSTSQNVGLSGSRFFYSKTPQLKLRIIGVPIGAKAREVVSEIMGLLQTS